MTTGTPISLTLSRAEAVVLFEFLARTSQDEIRATGCHAEQVVLWNLEALLETSLSEPLQSDYAAVLSRARQEAEEN